MSLIAFRPVSHIAHGRIAMIQAFIMLVQRFNCIRTETVSAHAYIIFPKACIVRKVQLIRVIKISPNGERKIEISRGKSAMTYRTAYVSATVFVSACAERRIACRRARSAETTVDRTNATRLGVDHGHWPRSAHVDTSAYVHIQ